MSKNSEAAQNIGRKIFIRNTRASDLLELFFISAVSSVLLLRFYLHITNYPSIEAGALHIAHVLWGGLLLMIGVIANLAFLGYRAQKVAAIVGGIGFGLFIDEIGKFITKDNNYFFEPAVGILYAIFVMLFIVFSYIDNSRSLSKREYQINALYQIEEAIINDMNQDERNRILDLLKKSGPSHISHSLRTVVESINSGNTKHRSHTINLATWLKKIDNIYDSFWRNSSSNIAIKILFLAQLIVIAGLNVLSIYRNIDDIVAFFESNSPSTYGQELILLQFISSSISAVIVLYGIYLLASSRLQAFKLFKLAIIITLLLTQFFLFLRIEFSALPSFIFNILLYWLIIYVIDKEKKNKEL